MITKNCWHSITKPYQINHQKIWFRLDFVVDTACRKHIFLLLINPRKIALQKKKSFQAKALGNVAKNIFGRARKKKLFEIYILVWSFDVIWILLEKKNWARRRNLINEHNENTNKKFAYTESEDYEEDLC